MDPTALDLPYRRIGGFPLLAVKTKPEGVHSQVSGSLIGECLLKARRFQEEELL